MANRTKFTPEKSEKFLDYLRDTPNVSRACRLLSVSRRSVYDHRAADADFASAWDDAVDEGVDKLEETALKRAKDTSDTLMIFLLKALRPDKYRETTRHEHTGKDGCGIEINFRLLGDAPPKPNDNG